MVLPFAVLGDQKSCCSPRLLAEGPTCDDNSGREEVCKLRKLGVAQS